MFGLQLPAAQRKFTNRHGRHDDMKELRCMSFTSKGTAEIIAAGLQDTMLVIDLNKGEVVKQVCYARSAGFKSATNNVDRLQPNINTR